jgi:transcriptional regulator with XRE-family HTH domain
LAGHLGLTFQQVQKYEEGTNRVGAARLQQIAKMLGVEMPFFYDGDGKEPDVESVPRPQQRFQSPSVARLHRHQKSIGADTACKFGRDDSL